MSCCSNSWSVASRLVNLGAAPSSLLPGPGGSVARADEVLDRRGAEPATGDLGLEGPGEGSAPECELQAVGRGVQVRSTARCPARRIGDDLQACSPVTGDDAQQLELGGPLPTADAGANAASSS